MRHEKFYSIFILCAGRGVAFNFRPDVSTAVGGNFIKTTMTFKLLKDNKEIGTYENMEAVDKKIEQICRQIKNYRSHDSIYPNYLATEERSSYLVHTKILLTDDSVITITHALIIDK